jgi:hypothetical protein
MREAVRKVPKRRRYAAFAILALFVMAATVTSATARTGRPHKAAFRAVISAIDNCGYSGTQDVSTTRTLVKFNESTVLKGISTTGIDASNNASSTATVQVYYSDEWEMNAGNAPLPVVWQPTYAKAGSTTIKADDAGTNPNDLNNTGTTTQTPTPTTTATRTSPWGNGTGVDPNARPMGPVIFVTKVAGNAAANTPAAGDWQDQGFTHEQEPDFVGGMWKATNEGHLQVAGKDAAANGTYLGPHSDLPFDTSLASIEKYGAEARFDISGLDAYNPATGLYEPVKGGGTYKVQMMVHDGDQNKGGGDTGEACRIVKIAPAPSSVVTTPTVKVSETINITIDTSTNANASIENGDSVIVRLIKRGPPPGTTTLPNSTTVVNGQTVDARGCTPANQAGLASGTNARKQGNDYTIIIGTGGWSVDATGKVVRDPAFGSSDLTYPDDFGGAAAPALTPGATPTGDYWWFVQYTPNANHTDVSGSNDDCSESFNLNFTR